MKCYEIRERFPPAPSRRSYRKKPPRGGFYTLKPNHVIEECSRTYLTAEG